MSTCPVDRNQHATDRAIIDHVALYKLTIAAAAERLFFAALPGGGGAQTSLRTRNALDALVQHKRLVRGKFPQGEPFYVLPGVKRPPNTQTIDYDLAALWLCAMQPGLRFHRLETAEIRKLFPSPPHHHVRHVVGDAGDGPVVYRLYPTAVDVKTTLKRLKGFIAETRTRLGLASWLEAGDYGFIVCCETDAKSAQVAELVMSRAGERLADEARIIVATAPTSASIAKGVKP